MALKIEHTVADGPGMVQFLAAVAELVRGMAAPMVRPVWERELLMATPDKVAPPRMFAHMEYDDVPYTNGNTVSLDSLTHRSFFFGLRGLTAIRSHLPPALRSNATTFEVLTGCLWRCRTLALAPAADEEMRMIILVSVRGRKHGAPVIPIGYYGNAFAFQVTISTAGNLCDNPMSYAVELVMKTKREVDMEYMRSVARLMVRRGRPHVATVRTYLVADVSKFGFGSLDFGWGTPVYAGLAKGDVGDKPGVANYLIPVKNANGEDGVSVSVFLPGPVMAKFVEEMRRLMHPDVDSMEASPQLPVIRSAI